MKKLILATLVAASAFVSSTSYAACAKTGYIERVTTVPGGGATLIYIRPNSIFNAYFSATTTDVKLVSAATAAATSRTYVSLTGNVAACPPNNGSLGGIVNLIVAP